MRIACLMDPWETLKPYKDSSLALLEAAAARGHQLFVLTAADMAVRDGHPLARLTPLRRDPGDDYGFVRETPVASDLGRLDAILMRKDPPFDMAYVYMTYALELAERSGVQVINRPQSLRDCNEKFFISHFLQCCAPTLISADLERLRDFHGEQQDIILKPLDGMGGQGILRIGADGMNLASAFELLSEGGRFPIMAQRYLSAIAEGDKRILMIDGEPVPYALARLPGRDATRANLAAGGHGVVQPLSDRDRWICAELGAALQKRGLRFVGLDVIGDYLTEINVTSPTCVREIEAVQPVAIGERLIRSLETVHATR